MPGQNQADHILYGITESRRVHHEGCPQASPSGYWSLDEGAGAGIPLPITPELLDWCRRPGSDYDHVAEHLRQLREANGGALLLATQLDTIDDGVDATMADGSNQILITTNSTVWLMHEQFDPEISIPVGYQHLPSLSPLLPDQIIENHGVVGYGLDPNVSS